MIGDWVSIDEPDKYAGCIGRVMTLSSHRDEDGFYLTVFVSGAKGTLYTEVFNEDLRPIPITPEILEKNFRVVERSSDGYNLVINSELILAFHLKATLDFWIAQPRDCPNLTYSLPLPKYVHELQHALRLCGIEKEIVL